MKMIVFFSGLAACVGVGVASAGSSAQATAKINIVRTGFSQGRGAVEAGLILQNPTSFDARGVTVTVNAVSGPGRVIGSDSSSTEVIPAHSTYYWGAELLEVRGRAVRLEAFSQVDSWSRHAYRLPSVTNVRITRDYFGPGVAGEIQNTLRGTLSSLARLTFVVYDSRGNITGGGYTFPDADIPRGRRVAFDNHFDTITSSRARYARASMENSGTGFGPVPG